MRFLFAAGGTGGTVIPAITVAKTVQEKNKDAKILFVGTERGFETKLVPQAGFELELINIGGLKRMGIFSTLRNFLELPKTFWQCWKILNRFHPTAVFGTGGYASGPILLLAAFLRKKTAILEPNTVPGFANRVLGCFVRTIYVAFEEAAQRLPKKKCRFSGLPIRQDILTVAPPNPNGLTKTILIFGGSQGARKLNETLLEGLSELADLKDKIFFIHQTGTKDETRVREAYAKFGFNAEVSAFIDDMASAYAKSDLIVARSGSSVLEVAACGRPSILIPFPFSADDHQELNARVLEQVGAAIYIPEEKLNGTLMAKWIRELVGQPNRLREMSQNALKLRKEHASDQIASYLLEAA